MELWLPTKILTFSYYFRLLPAKLLLKAEEAIFELPQPVPDFTESWLEKRHNMT
jgi:hypothetical protein